MDNLLDFHQMTAEQAAASLSSGKDGLDDKEVSLRHVRFGYNELAQKEKESDFDLFLGQFQNSLVAVLLAAAAISFLLALDIQASPFAISIKSFTEVLDAVAILAIVILNSVFGFIQERNAAKALDALAKMMAPIATVLRGGNKQKIAARLLVPGDVIFLEEGDRVPADCRIIELRALEIDESALTGESVPVSKEVFPIRDSNVPLAERKNIAFMSTVVTRGRASALVVATGMSTQMGKISEMVESADDESTPLQEKLEEVARNLGYIALGISVLVFLIGILEGKELFEMFLTTVSIAVAAIPEGLPAIVTLSLAFGVQRMAKKNAIIRRLPACETLGSATVICTDKTGTITKNEMTAKQAYAGGYAYEVSGSGYGEEGKVFQAVGGASGKPASVDSNEAYRMTVVCAVACNNAKLVAKAASGRHGHGAGDVGIIGDPMEAALLVFGRKAGIDRDALEMEYLFEDEIPFDSNRKMMSTLWKKGSDYHLFSKGAPEVLLSKSAHYLDASGKLHELSPESKEDFSKIISKYAVLGLRVIGFAYKNTEIRKCDESVENGLVFCGVVGLYDPPREEIARAVETCKQAGIRVVMITGDNPGTALTIARHVGIASDGDEVVTGRELDEMTEIALAKRIEKIAVFARVAPEHKIRIVTALKARGEVVAMTGDGVNDAPALKKSDIGVSMGLSGTDVAKESSDMVLADDNFASIVSAIEEGRIIYDNIVKSVRYLVSCNIGEVMVIFFALVFGFEYLPLLPLQILWMNLATDGLPALSLGSDTPEAGLMRRKPRSKQDEILGMDVMPEMLYVGTIIAIGTLGLFLWELSNGSGIDTARTVAFSTIIIFQLFHSFNMRSPHTSIFKSSLLANRKLVFSFAIGLVLQLMIIYLPVAQKIFRTAALPPFDLAVVLLVSASIIPLEEIRKAVARRK